MKFYKNTIPCSGSSCIGKTYLYTHTINYNPHALVSIKGIYASEILTVSYPCTDVCASVTCPVGTACEEVNGKAFCELSCIPIHLCFNGTFSYENLCVFTLDSYRDVNAILFLTSVYHTHWQCILHSSRITVS